MGLLRIKPYSKITVTELCRLADINRGTFYIHYFDVDDVLDDIVTESFSDVSQTIGHVLCPQKETCTYPFCQKVQENKELWPLFMDLSFLFSFLPHIPIKFNLWLPDEEFPASGKILFDASAENDLQIEAAGTAAAICLSLLEKVIE